MTEVTLKKTIYLKATTAKVWQYLTDPEKLATWFHKPGSALTDGEYEMVSPDSGERFMWGEVLIAEPFTRLEYTFSIAPMGDRSSKVIWTLEEVAGGTRLSLSHEGLPQGEEAFGLALALDKGWDEHLGGMRDSLHEN